MKDGQTCQQKVEQTCKTWGNKYRSLVVEWWWHTSRQSSARRKEYGREEGGRDSGSIELNWKLGFCVDELSCLNKQSNDGTIIQRSSLRKFAFWCIGSERCLLWPLRASPSKSHVHNGYLYVATERNKPSVSCRSWVLSPGLFWLFASPGLPNLTTSNCLICTGRSIN